MLATTPSVDGELVQPSAERDPDPKPALNLRAAAVLQRHSSVQAATAASLARSLGKQVVDEATLSLQKQQKVLKAFTKTDVNHDNYISRDEWKG